MNGKTDILSYGGGLATHAAANALKTCTFTLEWVLGMNMYVSTCNEILALLVFSLSLSSHINLTCQQGHQWAVGLAVGPILALSKGTRPHPTMFESMKPSVLTNTIKVYVLGFLYFLEQRTSWGRGLRVISKTGGSETETRELLLGIGENSVSRLGPPL